MSDSWLAGPVTTAAYGWLLHRSDGVALGFTSYDRDVVLNSLTLRASPGMVPTTITESLGLEHDGLELKAALTADAISNDDLMAGRWDGAQLQVFLFDWADPGSSVRPLAHGELGAVSLGEEGFIAELIGPTRQLDKAVVPVTSPGCRARFCDAACGLSSARFQHIIMVTADGAIVACDGDWPVPADNLVHGSLRWLDGENCGLNSDIVAASGTHVELAQAPYFAVETPVRVALFEGCDKRLETCAARFGNVLNFRGEPYLPGNDLLTRFPGG